MRWFSRRFRNPSLPRIAITIAAPGSILGDDCQEQQWRQAFRELDSRGIPVTWAVVNGKTRLPLGEVLVASSVSHELAFVDGMREMPALIPDLQQQARLAGRIGVSLRTFVATAGGIHPALLAQLGVTAVVPLAPNCRSRTGSLRALAWNLWEAPITDEFGGERELAGSLRARLDALVHDSTRMHLLLRTDPTTREGFGDMWSRFLDRAADYHARGWLRFETVGQAAAEIGLPATPAASRAA